MTSSLVVLCLILLLSALLLTDAKENRRVTKEVEDKVKKLDPATKKRILAMDAAGMVLALVPSARAIRSNTTGSSFQAFPTSRPI